MPVIRLARRLIWQILHLPEFIFGRNYISTNIFFQNLHFPENLFSRVYTCQNLHLIEITFPRKLIFHILVLAISFRRMKFHLVKITLRKTKISFGKNYITQNLLTYLFSLINP